MTNPIAIGIVFCHGFAQCWAVQNTPVSQAPVVYAQPAESNMPHREWETRWSNMIQAGSEAGCQAQVVQAVPRSSGFGAKLWYRVTSIWMTMLNPGVSYVWDASSGFDKGWWSYFQNDAGIAEPQCDFPDTRYLPDYDYEQLKVTGRLAAQADHHYMAALHHFAVMKIWTLKPTVQADIGASLTALLGEAFTHGDYLGVHIRRGDKATEAPATPTQAYVAQILDFSNKLGINVAYIATDDPLAVDQARHMLAGKVEVLNLPAVDPAGRGQYDGDGLLSVLTDVTALQHSKAFIGTSSSTFGRLVYWLRGDQEISISLDGTGDFLTNYS